MGGSKEGKEEAKRKHIGRRPVGRRDVTAQSGPYFLRTYNNNSPFDVQSLS